MYLDQIDDPQNAIWHIANCHVNVGEAWEIYIHDLQTLVFEY